MPGEHLWRQQEWDRRMEASLVLPTDRSPWRAPVEHAGTCSAHWAGGEPLSILVAPHSPTCPGQSCFLLRGPKQEPRPYVPAPSHLAFPGESKRGRRPAPCRPKPQPASLTVPPPPAAPGGLGPQRGAHFQREVLGQEAWRPKAVPTGTSSSLTNSKSGKKSYFPANASVGREPGGCGWACPPPTASQQ